MLSLPYYNLHYSISVKVLLNFIFLDIKMYRWAVPLDKINLNVHEWQKCLSCIQLEEQARVNKFVYKKDSISALIGRLLIRKFLHLVTGLPNNEIKVTRTEKGRPVYTDNPGIHFNISHQGDYAILAGSTKHNVGVDVMKIEYRSKKPLNEFFHTLRRQFHPEEWAYIKECDSLSRFYRIWCLKEAYVKAVGVGIGFSLDRLRFKINSSLNCCDTEVFIDGQKEADYIFEEVLFDNHITCIAIECKETPGAEPYQMLGLSDLIDDLVPITPASSETAENCYNKIIKPP